MGRKFEDGENHTCQDYSSHGEGSAQVAHHTTDPEEEPTPQAGMQPMVPVVAPKPIWSQQVAKAFIIVLRKIKFL